MSSAKCTTRKPSSADLVNERDCTMWLFSHRWSISCGQPHWLTHGNVSNVIDHHRKFAIAIKNFMPLMNKDACWILSGNENTHDLGMCLETKFYYETLLKEEWRAKHIMEEQDCAHMRSDLASSAKYPEMKRAAEDREWWRATNKKGMNIII